MLQNARVAASELFRENKQEGCGGGKIATPPHPPTTATITQIRVKTVGYFLKRAPSCIIDRMFDRILNAILPNNLS